MDFFNRLARARVANRAQYVFLQACSLVQPERLDMVAHARELLDLLLRDYPDAKIFLARAYSVRAEAHVLLGNVPAALDDYRRALAVELGFPNVQTRTRFDLPWLIVCHRLTHAYDEALKIVDEHDTGESLGFPVDEFIRSAVRAFVAEHRRDLTTASHQASRALEAAALSHSGLSRHPTVGVVDGTRWKLEIDGLRRITTLARRWPRSHGA